MKAIWNNKIIAESDQTVVIENNHYFPQESIKKNTLKPLKPTALARGKVERPILP